MKTVRVSNPLNYEVDVYPNARFASNDKAQLEIRVDEPDHAFISCKMLALYPVGHWSKAVYVYDN